MSRCTVTHYTCDCRDKEVDELKCALREAYDQLAWVNREFGPHASTNVVLVRLQKILERGE